MNSRLLSEPQQAGFTLLEVLISMSILVFISFAIFQATTQTYKLRDTLMTEGNFYNSIRLSTTILQRDIALIYSPLVTMNIKKPDPNTPPGTVNPQEALINSAGDDLGQTFTFWSRAIDISGVRPARFTGTDNKLTFISLSHIRIYKDAPESEFAKITYELKREKSDAENPDTQILVKTESPNAFAVDESRDTMGRSYELLHGVKKLSYTYYQRDGNTWKNFRSWDSDKEETKNLIPDIIELKIEVVGPKKQVFEGRYKFRPEIPLNGINPST